jgi:hypothetical protein
MTYACIDRWKNFVKNSINKPARVFVSARISSVNFFGRKNFSGKNEKLDSCCVGVVIVAAVVIGNVAVASGRIPIVDDESTGTSNEGFLINDKNKCRHKSSGISELSTSKSRNCRKPL